MTNDDPDTAFGEKEERILEAVIAVLSRGGIAAVSMRAVAKEADVALGLMNYYFNDKSSLIAAALRRVGDEDARLLDPLDDLEPADQLRHALRRVVNDALLSSGYLGLRLQLWSLAAIDPESAAINLVAQTRYLDRLGDLIAAARPDLDSNEVSCRAADVLVVQNGMWLTSILNVDSAIVERSVQRCEYIAFS
ncbi:MAG: AcrR family transcriptional regulator [Candidatus Aldehydirespiratoraceae bacterium]|jgi:AcrR family transcriptional regulator